MTEVRLVGAVASPVKFMLDALGPTIRLARANANSRGEAALGPTLRLAASATSASPKNVVTQVLGDVLAPREGVEMTTTRLVGATDSTQRPDMEAALAPRGGEGDRRPALLISYAYWKSFAIARARYSFRDYALDSGAYTVEHSGGTVDLGEYTAFCRERLSTDPQCTEVFALDVISDWRASKKNVEAMWCAGVPAIPVYHRGEPEDVLVGYAKDYPKIALGGFSRLKGPLKLAWAKQCFARVWPARVHGLAVMGESLLMALPFHSVDASNWEQGPAAFGNYKSMDAPSRAPRGGKISLRAEVEWYLKLERRVQQRWARELAALERDLPPWPRRKAG